MDAIGWGLMGQKAGHKGSTFSKEIWTRIFPEVN